MFLAIEDSTVALRLLDPGGGKEGSGVVGAGAGGCGDVDVSGDGD